jgi:hypothetical protein
MSPQTRPTIVVSLPAMLSIDSSRDRFSRKQDSCTASLAALSEPSVR